jgi:DNA helicase-2/ATP-dependent DNA helicase PcrA
MLSMADLNKQQHQATLFGELDKDMGVKSGPLLIVAGAGTGKTNTLAHRTAHLITNDVSPERILLMTFSRRAANELSTRVNLIVEHQLRQTAQQFSLVKLPWMGTFHSVANRLLRMYAKSIGLDPAFVIMDRNDAADMLDLIRHKLGYSGTDKRFPRKNTCLDIYSRCVNGQTDLIDVLNKDFPWCQDWHDELKLLFKNYVQQKVEQSCLDYDDLLLYWYHMAGIPDIAVIIRAKFDHILVDEYQDTNLLQANLLLRLFPQGNGLTVVGDDAQSIYSFRSADVDNILNFPNQFNPPAKVISLQHNYRSTQPILDLSNTLLKQSNKGYKIDLISNKKGGTKPQLVTVEDDVNQAKYIIDTILAARESGMLLKQQAVLFRSSHHSDRLELSLTQRNIPYVKHGGLKFLEAGHIKDLLSIMRFADNPKHQVSGFRVLKMLPRVGPRTAESILGHIASQNHDLYSLMTYQSAMIKNQQWLELCKLLPEVHHNNILWSDQLAQVAKWYKDILQANYDDHFARWGDIEQLIRMSQQYTSRERFLSELTLDPPISSGALAGSPLLDDDFLVLSTIHSAKGQEWKNVYVLNVADGNFPNEYACGDDKLIEEERRLLYVAMTRAQTQLHLIQPLKYWVPQQQSHGNRHVYGGKSRFLTEELIEKLQSITYPRNRPTVDEQLVGQKALADIRQSILNSWI